MQNSIIGLQRRVSPVPLRIKSLLAEGIKGNVLSGHVSSYGALLPLDALPEGMEYFAERKYGGNSIITEYGHSLDWVHEVLGELKNSKVGCRFSVQKSRS